MKAFFRFHAELNDFLPPPQRGVRFAVDCDGSPAVKHSIEALGVPHPEVDRILRQDEAIQFRYRVQAGDEIDVFPWALNNGHAGLDAQDRPPPEPRFVLDNHLGKLATYLRILGFNCLYRNDYQDDELAQVAGQEQRILLTRDRRLLMRSAVVYGYCLRSLEPAVQLAEVVRRFKLSVQMRPFHRCLRCNTPLEPVRKADILHRLKPLTRQFYDEFYHCHTCDKLFWKGSHYEHMLTLIEKLA